MLKLYHWSPNKFDTFNQSYQGIHLATTIQTCKELAKARGLDYNSGYLYTVIANHIDKPAIFDIDPLDWSGKEIANMLLHKLLKMPIYGATSEIDNEGNNWKDENSPDLIKVQNLTIADKDILKSIKGMSNKDAVFKEICKFLQAKGYNCIKYNNYGESKYGLECYIIFDPADLKIESVEDLQHTSTKLNKLTEDTRQQLANASKKAGEYKDKSRGKNRWERKKYSKVSTQVKSYNQIDMNDFFKQDILLVKIPVQGESDTYIVTIKLEGVLAEIARHIKSHNNQFEYKTVLQSITKVFNTTNVYVKCECPDFKYRMAHWSIINNWGADDTAHDPGPGKSIANPNNDKGKGCKHILLCIANGSWIMKVCSVICNYTLYMAEHNKKAFDKIMFPKLYGIQIDDAQKENLIPEDINLDSTPNIIDLINDYAKNKGKFKAGSNKNTAKGSGKLTINSNKTDTAEIKDDSNTNNKAENTNMEDTKDKEES